MKWGIGLFLRRKVLKHNWEILWALRRLREWLSSLVGGRRSFVLSMSASPSANLRQWSSLLVASDSISQSLRALLYDKKLWPRTIMHARHWTCSMVLVCLSVRDEFHTTSAYSKRGRMYPLYTVISSSFLKPNLFDILNIYRRRLVLEIFSEMFLIPGEIMLKPNTQYFCMIHKVEGTSEHRVGLLHG